MTVTDDDPRPPYVQLADALSADIREGRLKPGAKVPPVRKLAEQFGVSPMTVQSALRLLRERGDAVAGPQGRGTVVAGAGNGLAARSELDELRRELTALTDRVSALEQRQVE